MSEVEISFTSAVVLCDFFSVSLIFCVFNQCLVKIFSCHNNPHKYNYFIKNIHLQIFITCVKCIFKDFLLDCKIVLLEKI
jgi:hypothetical protein